MHPTHIPTKLASFSECWSPKIVKPSEVMG